MIYVFNLQPPTSAMTLNVLYFIRLHKQITVSPAEGTGYIKHSSHSRSLCSSSSICFLRLLAAANQLSETATVLCFLFKDFIVIVLAAVCAFAVVTPFEYVFPLKVF